MKSTIQILYISKVLDDQYKRHTLLYSKLLSNTPHWENDIPQKRQEIRNLQQRLSQTLLHYSVTF